MSSCARACALVSPDCGPGAVRSPLRRRCAIGRLAHGIGGLLHSLSKPLTLEIARASAAACACVFASSPSAPRPCARPSEPDCTPPRPPCCFNVSFNRRVRSASRSCSPARRRTVSLPASPWPASTAPTKFFARRRPAAALRAAFRPARAAARRAASPASAVRARAASRARGFRSRSPARILTAQIARRGPHLLGHIAHTFVGAATLTVLARRDPCCPIDPVDPVDRTVPADPTALVAPTGFAVRTAPTSSLLRLLAGLVLLPAICRASSSAFCRRSDCSRVSFSSSRFSSSSVIGRAAREFLLPFQQFVLPACQVA